MQRLTVVVLGIGMHRSRSFSTLLTSLRIDQFRWTLSSLTGCTGRWGVFRQPCICAAFFPTSEPCWVLKRPLRIFAVHSCIFFQSLASP